MFERAMRWRRFLVLALFWGLMSLPAARAAEVSPHAAVWMKPAFAAVAGHFKLSQEDFAGVMGRVGLDAQTVLSQPKLALQIRQVSKAAQIFAATLADETKASPVQAWPKLLGLNTEALGRLAPGKEKSIAFIQNAQKEAVSRFVGSVIEEKTRAWKGKRSEPIGGGEAFASAQPAPLQKPSPEAQAAEASRVAQVSQQILPSSPGILQRTLTFFGDLFLLNPEKNPSAERITEIFKRESKNPARLSWAPVNKEFTEALNVEIIKYPLGRRLLASIKTPPTIVFLDYDEEVDLSPFGAAAVVGESGSVLSFTTRYLIGAIHTTQELDAMSAEAEAASTRALRTPEGLRRYADQHPEILSRMARDQAENYVHELTHVLQQQRSPGFFKYIRRVLDSNTISWRFLQKLNSGKYPIGQELEAYGNGARYLHEQARANPFVRSWRHVYGRYSEYMNSLSDFRARETAGYRLEAAPIDQLHLYGKKEKETYRTVLAQEEKDWPRISVEGLLFLLRWDPARGGLAAFEQAYDRAVKYGLLDELRPLLANSFRGILEALEIYATDLSLTNFYGHEERILFWSKRFHVSLPSRVAERLEKSIRTDIRESVSGPARYSNRLKELFGLERVCRLAWHYGMTDDLRSRLASKFMIILGTLEAKLGKYKAKTIPAPYLPLIETLSDELKVPLPLHVAAVVNKK